MSVNAFEDLKEATKKQKIEVTPVLEKNKKLHREMGDKENEREAREGEE